ncbi:hypothetical protein WG904_02855 [Pedobacter sp. Du54]|uniref:hypothetical protein n=1 Tax=Pedobacter anseongensis TaxID=3133439 RepID=UPI0030A56B0F
MNTRYIFLIAFFIFSATACKKENNSAIDPPKIEIPDVEDSPTISYKLINQKLKAADIKPMNLDVNDDGIVDCSYFMQYVFLSGKVHLYAGVNPVYGAATSSNEPNDNEYLNMGLAHTFAPKKPIKNDLTWSNEFSLLSDRIDETNGSKTYAGNWGNGEAQMMSVRLPIKGKMHYAWAQLKFDKATEELVLIDVAWNTLPEQEINAGAK